MNKNFGSRKGPNVPAAASKKNPSTGLVIWTLALKAFLISLAIVFLFFWWQEVLPRAPWGRRLWDY